MGDGHGATIYLNWGDFDFRCDWKRQNRLFEHICQAHRKKTYQN